MLIIEGTDAVGKTTLAKKLAAILGEREGPWFYQHSSGPPPSKFDFPWSYMPLAQRFIVMDRFHMSEVVYRAVRGQKQRLCPEGYRLVDARLRTLGALTVVITASDEVIRRSSEETKEKQWHTVEQHIAANKIYADAYREGTAILSDRRYAMDADIAYHVELNSEIADGKGWAAWPAENSKVVNLILDAYLKRQKFLE